MAGKRARIAARERAQAVVSDRLGLDEARRRPRASATDWRARGSAGRWGFRVTPIRAPGDRGPDRARPVRPGWVRRRGLGRTGLAAHDQTRRAGPRPPRSISRSSSSRVRAAVHQVPDRRDASALERSGGVDAGLAVRALDHVHRRRALAEQARARSRTPPDLAPSAVISSATPSGVTRRSRGRRRGAARKARGGVRRARRPRAPRARPRRAARADRCARRAAGRSRRAARRAARQHRGARAGEHELERQVRARGVHANVVG